MDRDPATQLTLPTVILAGRTVVGEDDGDRITRRVWRFRVVADKVPIQAASLPWPYVNTTGEELVRGEEVLVDSRIERRAMSGARSCRRGCRRAPWTYLHLADDRGWVAEPSALPLSECAVHTNAELLQLVGVSTIVRSAARDALPPAHEYRLTAVAPLLVDAEWPGVVTGGAVASHANILVTQRVTKLVDVWGACSCCCNRHRRLMVLVTFLEVRCFLLVIFARNALRVYILWYPVRYLVTNFLSPVSASRAFVLSSSSPTAAAGLSRTTRARTVKRRRGRGGSTSRTLCGCGRIRSTSPQASPRCASFTATPDRTLCRY